MCGLVGFITTEQYKGARDRANFMEQGLIIDILRGEDSTGVFYGETLKPGYNAGWLKSADDGYTFSQSKAFQALIGGMSKLDFMVGHNRAATIGNITADTAHPFKFGPVVGVHNGTVRGNMDELPINFKDSGEEVDSACIMKNLAHVEPEDALTEVVSKIRGAYMLIWRDDRDGSLNFARNDTRSFHMMQSYAEDTIFFASEHGQLAWLNERLALGGSDIVTLRPGHALKFEAGSLDPTVKKFDIAPKWQAPTNTHRMTTTGSAGGHTSKPAGEAPGKPQGPVVIPQTDNRVLAGGKKRSVPQPLQMQLLNLEPQPLQVEDRLQFTPILRQPANQLRSPDAQRWVVGHIDSIQMPAMLYGIAKHICDNAWNRRWTVRPIGVRSSYQDGRLVQMLVCKLVASVQQAEIIGLPKCSPGSTEDSPKEHPDGLKGPEGYSISTVDWLTLTSNGCVCCGRALHAREADEIRWDLTTGEPQCGDCAKIDDQAIAALEFGGYNPVMH